jgi:parvulin-like peptidyl-prolyl isomerase
MAVRVDNRQELSFMTRRLLAMVVAAMAVGVGGCAMPWQEKGPPEVRAGEFYRPGVGVTTAAGTAAAEQTATPTPAMRSPAVLTAPVVETGAPGGAAVSGSSRGGGVSAGSFMTMGGVVSEVNGVPIFATPVMREIEPILAVRAKALSQREFQSLAMRLIQQQIGDFEREELEYASAQRNLDSNDRKVADMITGQWRQERIVEAGGSVEMARRKATEAGENFDEMVQRQSRIHLIQLYYQKKVVPRVQITTADMRRFYRDNVDKLFTERDTTTYRVIRIDPAQQGGKEGALTRARALREQATTGDFAAMAGESNDDRSLKRTAGLVGPLPKGAFALERVEEAVFRTDVGGITEIVEDRGGFYIAKVEGRKLGSVRSFDELEVQAKIKEELRKLQIAEMRDRVVEDLRSNAVIRRDDRMMQIAADMAMQRYAAWRSQ